MIQLDSIEKIFRVESIQNRAIKELLKYGCI